MRPRKNLKGRLVWCEWLDAHHRDDWFPCSEADEWAQSGLALCETTGVLIAITEEVLVIAVTATSSHCGGAWMIPWVHVKDIREIVDE